MIRNTTKSWGTLARAFHWILGITILGMLAFGWWMNHIPARPDRFFYRSIHADIGYVLLVLTALRVNWARDKSTPGVPVRYAAVATDRRLDQPCRALFGDAHRHHARMGAFG